MAVELGKPFFSAALDVACTSFHDEPRTGQQLFNHLTAISDVILELKPMLESLKSQVPDIKSQASKNYDLACNFAAPFFPTHWKPPLLDFAAELIAAVLLPNLVALRFEINTSICNLDMPHQVLQSYFSCNLTHNNTPERNAYIITKCFEEILVFNNHHPIPPRRRPFIHLTIVRACSNCPQYADAQRARLIIRLATLLTSAFGWRDERVGTLSSSGAIFSTIDDYVDKQVHDRYLSSSIVSCVSVRANSKQLPTITEHVVDTITKAFRERVSTVRAIILSHRTWTSTPATDVEYYTKHIRMYESDAGFLHLEMLVDAMEEWDHLNVPCTLYHAMSAAVVVFRFASLSGLEKLFEFSSKHLVKFPNLTSKRRRVLFVDTFSPHGLRQVREAVSQLAYARRFDEPTGHDILFENDCDYDIKGVIAQRIRENRSILHANYEGSCRKLLEQLIHVLNREVRREEALEESIAVADMILRLRSRLRTKVQVRTKPERILIAREDYTGFGFTNRKGHLRVDDYKGFRDISEHHPEDVHVKVVFEGLPREVFEVSLMSSRWAAVEAISAKVRNDEGLFLGVVHERRTQFERNNERWVHEVKLDIFGGDMERFLNARAVSLCIELLNRDRSSNEQHYTRVLLRLMPSLRSATRTPWLF